jgi:hypothetical protein
VGLLHRELRQLVDRSDDPTAIVSPPLTRAP